MRASRWAGFTIVEVVIALMILTVGVLGAFAMQASALRGTTGATISQEVSNIAESELQLQREFYRVVELSNTGETCRSNFDSGLYTCTVDVHPCVRVLGDVECRQSSTSLMSVVARQVVVSVTGPGNRSIQVSTVVN